jgi:hypothetical protein
MDIGLNIFDSNLGVFVRTVRFKYTLTLRIYFQLIGTRYIPLRVIVFEDGQAIFIDLTYERTKRIISIKWRDKRQTQKKYNFVKIDPRRIMIQSHTNQYLLNIHKTLWKLFHNKREPRSANLYKNIENFMDKIMSYPITPV